MKFFLDTANLDEIREAASLGILDGVTTNPSLIAKEKANLKNRIVEICRIVNGPVNAEVVATDTEGMCREGRELARLHPNVVVKIPMLRDGLKAVKRLVEEGIPVNVTLCFSAAQALLIAKAGGTFVGGPGPADRQGGRHLCKPVSGASGRHQLRGHEPDPRYCNDLQELFIQDEHPGGLASQSPACGGGCQGGSPHCHPSLQGLGSALQASVDRPGIGEVPARLGKSPWGASTRAGRNVVREVVACKAPFGSGAAPLPARVGRETVWPQKTLP